MNFFTFKKLNYRLLGVVLCLCVLSACSTSLSMQDNSPPAVFSDLPENASYYLGKNKIANNTTRLQWQFVTLQALIKEQKLMLAQPIIDYLQQAVLSPQEKAILTLLIADKFYADNDFNEAQITLDYINKTTLPDLGLIHFYQLQINLYITAEAHLDATKNIFSLLPLLSETTIKQEQHDHLLNQLSLLTSEHLNQLIRQSSNLTDIDKNKKAWYDLALLYQSYKLQPNELLRKVDSWKTKNPMHPAATLLPSQLLNIDTLSPYRPRKIAVILPLSGRFKRQGSAIQAGLLDAFYQQLKQQKDNLLQDKTSPKIFFYDSQSQNMQDIEKQLRLDKVDFVIGPLLKANIQTLLPLIEDIPTLAFNALQSKNDTTSLDEVQLHYAFPLSPEEEAKQAAELITYQQHKNPLVLAPKGSYGKRVSLAFSRKWKALHPADKKTVERYYFTDKHQLGTFVEKVLQNDASKRRIAQMKMITQLTLETEIRSRRDIDAIYIISKRDELILLKPFIDVSVSPFAKSIPLYANSRSNSFDRSKQNKELSKLTFSDSPFLLTQDKERLSAIQKAWKYSSFNTLRLFALGFDSYQLIGQLVLLQHDPKTTYDGIIGTLSVNENNLIQAKLSWARFENGVMFDVPSPTQAK